MAEYLNLAAFIDGTLMSEKSLTNVFKLKEALYTSRPYRMEAFPDGLFRTETNYERGPGTLPGAMITGGAFAADLHKAIGNNYAWLAQQLLNNAAGGKLEPRIFLFGFSRGAYSVHVLSWLLSEIGLPYEFSKCEKIVRAYLRKDSSRLERYKKNCFASPPIKLLGIWDAVSARFDIYQDYHDGEKAPAVELVCHAMAANERRPLFPVMQYRGRGEVEQTWFSGVHSDIGGGYLDDQRLSDITLEWMKLRAYRCGLGFMQRPQEIEDYDFSNLPVHNEAGNSAPNRCYAQDDLIHGSLLYRMTHSDGLYQPEIKEFPYASMG
ncbi:MAG: DUF2235 domain-containing protein [Kiritimatiellae bacterium]|nr:DUF2235 domain-containing protein [Kiritimatiellia bacterium]